MSLENNQLTCTIPPFIGSLAEPMGEVDWIELHNNLLTGDIPSSLCGVLSGSSWFSSGEMCFLGGNMLNRTCPSECSDTIRSWCNVPCLYDTTTTTIPQDTSSGSSIIGIGSTIVMTGLLAMAIFFKRNAIGLKID
jgi:hypothetical protein